MIFETTTHVTKKNREVKLEMVGPEKAQEVLEAMVQIASTTEFLLSSAEDFKKMSLEDEVKWIKSYNDDPRSMLIVARCENKIVGILDFRAYKNLKTRHRGGLGISLHQSIRGEGLGQILFHKLISLVKQIEDLTILELSVMSDNLQAYHLYKKVGFVEVGRKPKAFEQSNGIFNDEIVMSMFLK